MKEYYEDLWERLPRISSHRTSSCRRRFLLAEARPGDRALDLGCGEGGFTAELAAVVAGVVGAEVAEAAVRRARARHPSLEFRLVPSTGSCRSPTDSFDLVWSSEVIEHVADTARWLSEIRRVLAPGGGCCRRRRVMGGCGSRSGGSRATPPRSAITCTCTRRRSLRELLGEFGFGQVSVRTAGGVAPMRRLLLARAMG